MIKLPTNDLMWVQLARPTLFSLLHNENINGRDISVYMLLRCVTDFLTGEVALSKAELAKISSLNEQKIARGLQALQSEDYIRITQNKGVANIYTCLDVATLTPSNATEEHKVKWPFSPAGFSEVNKQLKKWVNDGDKPKLSNIHIEQSNQIENLNVQININQGNNLIPEKIEEMKQLAQKGLLPKILTELYPQVKFD